MNQKIASKYFTLMLLPILICTLLLSCSKKEKSSEPTSSLFDRDDIVKNAYISLYEKNIDNFRNEIYNSLTSYEGEVEGENWHNKNRINGSISITIRLPSKHFLSYINFLNENYKIDSMQMYANKTTDKSIKNREVDNSGIVYSFVHIYVSKKIGYLDSLIIGTENASEALKYSLESIIPVILFLLPYLIIIAVCITIYKKIKTLTSKKKKNLTTAST